MLISFEEIEFLKLVRCEKNKNDIDEIIAYFERVRGSGYNTYDMVYISEYYENKLRDVLKDVNLEEISAGLFVELRYEDVKSENNVDKVIVSVSGGKDSTATLIFALDNFDKSKIVPVFLDTQWEHHLTYQYLDYLEKALNISIERIKTIGMEELCIRYKALPNTFMTFCKMNLKVKPFRRYIYENFFSKGIDFIVMQGIRKEESLSRSKTPHYKEEIEFYNRRKMVVKKFYPIVDWSKEKVINYIKNKGIKLNPLYDLGFSRVGCFPCVNWTKKELFMLDGEFLKRLRNLEKKVSNLRGTKVTFFKRSRDKFLLDNRLF